MEFTCYCGQTVTVPADNVPDEISCTGCRRVFARVPEEEKFMSHCFAAESGDQAVPDTFWLWKKDRWLFTCPNPRCDFSGPVSRERKPLHGLETLALVMLIVSFGALIALTFAIDSALVLAGIVFYWGMFLIGGAIALALIAGNRKDALAYLCPKCGQKLG